MSSARPCILLQFWENQSDPEVRSIINLIKSSLKPNVCIIDDSFLPAKLLELLNPFFCDQAYLIADLLHFCRVFSHQFDRIRV